MSAAFTVLPQRRRVASTQIGGYLDDLSKELYGPDSNPNIEAESKESTDMSKNDIDRYGPRDFSQFVDFNEFDGGDGRELER